MTDLAPIEFTINNFKVTYAPSLGDMSGITTQWDKDMWALPDGVIGARRGPVVQPEKRAGYVSNPLVWLQGYLQSWVDATKANQADTQAYMESLIREWTDDNGMVVQNALARIYLLNQKGIKGTTLLDDVDAAVKLLGQSAVIAWEYGREFPRSSPLLIKVLRGEPFSYTNEQIDGLFKAILSQTQI